MHGERFDHLLAGDKVEGRGRDSIPITWSTEQVLADEISGNRWLDRTV